MPATLTYPGVYVEEIPSGVRTITGVATSITAFLGRAVRGPTDDPVMINSFGDFEREFGGLDPDYPMAYAVRDFYLNGGSQAVIVRLHKGAEKAKNATLKLEASNEGEWGNNLLVTIDADGITDDVAKQFKLNKADLFNLSVSNDPTKPPIERYLNVSVAKDAGARRLDRVLEEESNNLRVTDLLTARPANSKLQKCIGGKDGDSLTQVEFLGDEDQKTGMYMLDKADLINLMCIPPDTRGGDVLPTIAGTAAVYAEAMDYCHKRRAMLIVDSPASWSANKNTAAAQAEKGLDTLGLGGEEARNVALYFPRVVETDPLHDGRLDTFAPCGIVAGIMARTDTNRGVWKAPAGLDAGINGIFDLDVNLNDAENGMLNPLGINCLRSFPPVGGRVVWGARTLRGADQLADEYKYVPVRRTALYIEESLYRGLKWVVFEPNDEPLWAQIRLNVGAFMHDLFRQHAFQGQTPTEAYFVKCDKETTTQSDIDHGIVNILVGFAPLKPAEFVVIKIQQMAGQIET